MKQGVPRWETCGKGDIEKGMLACFLPNDPRGATVQINKDHAAMRDQVAHWMAHYPTHPEEVAEAVYQVYGECAVCAIAHSEDLKKFISDREIKEKIRSPYSLTLALLGLMPHDRLISDRLASRLGKRRDPGTES